MFRKPVAFGIAAGLALAAMVLTYASRRAAAPPARRPGPLLSDCDGTLDQLVIHYVPEAAEIVTDAYRDFLSALPADVTVHVVCPDAAAFDELRCAVGPVACALRAVPAGHAMTTWSRDRWLSLAPPSGGGAATLLTPRAEKAAAIWPARQGDQLTAADIARRLGPSRTIARKSELLFDGGDFVADERCVFVTPGVAERNIQHTVADRNELVRALRRELGRKIVLLDEAPPYHAGMFMMTAGDGVMLVGDPSLGTEILGPTLPPDVMPPGADHTAETQRLFDAVARQCAAEGYRVVRMPTVSGLDGRTYLTYLNVILDRRDGRRIVYMPVFSDVEALNEAAKKVWQDLGWEVSRVDCTASYVHFGSLRCLVNVLTRGR